MANSLSENNSNAGQWWGPKTLSFKNIGLQMPLNGIQWYINRVVQTLGIWRTHFQDMTAMGDGGGAPKPSSRDKVTNFNLSVAYKVVFAPL